MKTAVVYFSRTGNGERIGKKLSDLTQYELYRIKDDMKWKGIFGYLKGGSYSMKWRKVNTFIEPDVELEAIDQIILVTPMWAGNIAPAVYSYLLDHPKVVKKTILLIQSAGTEGTQYAKMLQEKLGTFKRIYSIMISEKQEDTVINQVIKDLDYSYKIRRI